MRVHSRLQIKVDPELSLIVLFEHPTIDALAKHLDPDGEKLKKNFTHDSLL